MKIKQLKEILNQFPDNLDVVITKDKYQSTGLISNDVQMGVFDGIDDFCELDCMDDDIKPNAIKLYA